mmetsp:Transcript_7393/g.15851  ORF Transcript_7393/g.15851 Transcript_7393/m.15851 type:complete len:295 (+) Transcript_7393:268-1152(+)
MGRVSSKHAQTEDPIQRIDRKRLRTSPQTKERKERRGRHGSLRQEQGEASQKGGRESGQGGRKGTKTGRASGTREGKGRQTGRCRCRQFRGPAPDSVPGGHQQKMDEHRGSDPGFAAKEGPGARIPAGLQVGRKRGLCQDPIDHVHRAGSMLPERQAGNRSGHGQVHRRIAHRVHRRRRGDRHGSGPTRRFLHAKNGRATDFQFQVCHQIATNHALPDGGRHAARRGKGIRRWSVRGQRRAHPEAIRWHGDGRIGKPIGPPMDRPENARQPGNLPGRVHGWGALSRVAGQQGIY